MVGKTFTFNPKTDRREEGGWVVRTTRGGEYGSLTTQYCEACGQKVSRFSAGNGGGYAYGRVFAKAAKANHKCKGDKDDGVSTAGG